MPHEEQREKNIRLVTEVALDCFLANGIEKTKVADIALRSGLTERSAFRYFETKADLVLAASLLYWKRILERIDRMSHTASDGSTTGLQDAENVLVCYSQLYRLDPNGMRCMPRADSTRSKTSRPSRLRPPAARWPRRSARDLPTARSAQRSTCGRSTTTPTMRSSASCSACLSAARRARARLITTAGCAT